MASNEEEDRLSSPPDPVLLRILCFLDAKQAVVTGILSRRWRDLWTSIPVLDFHRHYPDGLEFKESYDESNFFRFVERTIVTHTARKIHRFRLCFYYHKNHAADVDVWICFAINRGVEEVDMDLIGYGRPDAPLTVFTVYYFYKLPSWLFKCETLVSLRLTVCEFEVPKFACFSSLVVLSLSKIWFLTGWKLQELLAACPLLEDLVITDCNFSSSNICFSSSTNPRLSRLDVNGHNVIVLEVDASTLQIFKYKSVIEACVCKDMSSLSEARLDISCWHNILSDLPSLGKSVPELRHAKMLELSSPCLQVLPIPSFKDLDC